MCAMRVSAAVLLAALVGCSASPAALDLLDQAERGLNDARSLEQDRHAEGIDRLAGQVSALDAAFDADVRLAEAGAIRDEQGRTVPLDGEWVISARRGYGAALRALHERQRQAEQAHATRLDNIDAAAEALDMARRLIVQQMRIPQDIRQRLLTLHRSAPHEQ